MGYGNYVQNRIQLGDAVFAAGKTDARRQAYLWLKATRAKAYAPLYAGAHGV